MGVKQSKTEKSEYCWYWKANPNPFDKSQGSYWAPYDIAVSEFIEENYEKRIYRFEIDIDEDTYIMDLKECRQYLKSDTFRQRPIRRARRDEDINIHRENRFMGLMTGLNSNNNLVEFEEEKNLQEKLKVREILGYEVDKTSEIYNLFNQEICVSSKICKELKKEFKENPTLTKLNTVKEIESFIADEITKQAERNYNIDKDRKVINTLNKQDSTYIKQAKIYNKTMKELEMPIYEKLIYMYTLEGFLVYSVNSILRQGSVINFNLHLYFILLQASVAIASTKYNPLIPMKALQTIDGKDYYKLFRGAKISEKIIIKDMENQNEKGSGRFLVFNEFLSTNLDQKVGESFMLQGKLAGDLVRVFYTILIPKSEADVNHNLMCFIEGITAHKNEFEVLLSSSTIFQIQNIEKKQIQDIQNNITKNIDLYDVTLMFISNGFKRFDFIKYSTLTRINLNNNEIGAEEARTIADAIAVNTDLTKFYIYNNKIGDFGAKAIADALRVNTSITEINLSSNQIGAFGAKAIGDALRVNTALTGIYINYNKIRDDGAKDMADAFRVNISLTWINLGDNEIGDDGVKAIADALRVNTALTWINLVDNKIGDDGAKALADAFTVNTALTKIYLNNNKIRDDGAKAIADALRVNTALKEIYLGGIQIRADGVKAIADALRVNTTLTMINLKNNEIRDDGAKAIADALRVNTALKEIYLNNNQIGDDGARAIEDVLRVNTSLTKIDLNNNKISPGLKDNLRIDNRLSL